MGENIVVVYGSGASFASGYKIKLKQAGAPVSRINPPIDREFFATITDEFLNNQKYYALRKFKTLLFGGRDCVGMEEVWTALDLNHKHISLDTYDWEDETADYFYGMDNQYPSMDVHLEVHGDTMGRPNKFKFLGDCGRDFRRLLYNVYSDYEKPEKDNYFQLLHEKIKESQNGLIGYITFNYDCYLEDALPTLTYVGANTNTGSLDALLFYKHPLIKLHGSLNWSHIQNGTTERVIQNGPPFKKDGQVEPLYESGDRWVEPAIIPPTAFKQDINDDLRANNHLTQALLQQWRAAITLLCEASKIIFVGYSFPVTDFHVKRIFQISVMRSTNPKKVLDCVGPDEGDKKEDFLEGIFRNKSVKTVRGFAQLIEGAELDEFLKL